ncbi:type 1 glutamine amidotransferase [Dokdonella sp.]|uniref:gamma-glutamyl-gamma-aminobutyrate hydrolase family protein n=1 Tax=Dokdonella sp. TaxID=2291710 RepID=UPI0025B7C018|nr:type 1 glutamine amidotransferase [Dokdonella sp.]MBX3693342.1 type 1 glutamine amidotransferase [Dokdonella sp.]MCW5567536.1 type 1 glutamine amidotransferase [Dokdonella sp.]
MSDETSKLLIGVSPRILRQVPTELGFRGKTLQYLEQSVAHWVMSLGAMVVMLPTVERESLIRPAHIDMHDIVASLDGLILQGGADIDPRSYGEEPTHTLGAIDAVRDRFELELVRGFAGAGKPVFGICRGHQLINVAFGGTLYQDLCADGATRERHVQAEAYDEHGHGLRFAEDGLLAAVHPGIRAARVNSIHHQGIKRLGAGLRVDAWSDDGVIEAIRGEGAGFIVGVQWHPEFHDGRDPGLLAADPLMRAFLDAARARRANRG